MQKKLKLAVLALCSSSMVAAQNTDTGKQEQTANAMDESAFTFTEAQLGENNDMNDNVTILNSNSNVYASQVGFLYSPMRFRYRALNQKYNDIYINGVPVNDMESGQFRYSMVGGINQQTRNVDFALPFESNNFSMTGLAGSNNYDFRAGSMAAGHRVTLSAANRNYTLRGMYNYASGFNAKGWAIAASIAYRWANRGYVEGTFYNSLSYYFGVQKKWNNGHSLALSTWGNPTERASQGASTDEAYWLANDYQYNPYWGYQNGHKRNSRIVNDLINHPAGQGRSILGNPGRHLASQQCSGIRRGLLRHRHGHQAALISHVHEEVAPQANLPLEIRSRTTGRTSRAASTTYGTRAMHATGRHKHTPTGRQPSHGGAARRTGRFSGTGSIMPTVRLPPTDRTPSTTCRQSTMTT